MNPYDRIDAIKEEMEEKDELRLSFIENFVSEMKQNQHIEVAGKLYTFVDNVESDGNELPEMAEALKLFEQGSIDRAFEVYWEVMDCAAFDLANEIWGREYE